MDSDLVICIIIVGFSLIFGLMYIIFPTKIREHNTLYYNRKRKKKKMLPPPQTDWGTRIQGVLIIAAGILILLAYMRVH